MTDDNKASDQAQMPALKIEEMMHWGVDPEGTQAVLIVQSASQGPVRLVLEYQTLAELVNVAQFARLQASKNAQAAGNDMLAATPVNSYKVASLAGGKMTLLMIDPNTQTEMVFALTNPADAIAIGRALVQEGMKAQQLNQAISGGKIVAPGPKRILRPN